MSFLPPHRAGARAERARPLTGLLPRRHRLLMGVACVGLAATGCLPPGPTQPDPPARVLSADDVTREAPRADAPVTEVAEGLDELALQLSLLNGGNGNLVLSPISLGVAFAMAEAGSNEPTTAQIEEVFGFPHQPKVHQAMNSMLQSFANANRSTNNGDVILDLANSLWVKDGLPVGEPFLDTLARHYGAGVNLADFPNRPAESRKAINDSVALVTRGRIPALVPESMVTPQTVSMLINAIYLKAPWARQFERAQTTNKPFLLGNGTTVQVPTMRTNGWFTKAAVGDGYTAIELPYAGGDLKMTIVAPKAGASFRSFEEGLTGDALRNIVAGVEPRFVNLTMPRWKAESQLDIGPLVNQLGLQMPGGDLGGIAPGVTLGGALHAANITVDEYGTEAAAATAISGVTSAPTDPLNVVIDRPFLFVIRHARTGAPLFYGRIVDPRG